MQSSGGSGGDPTGFSTFLKESARLQRQNQSEGRGYIPTKFLRRLSDGPHLARDLAVEEEIDVREFAVLIDNMLDAGLIHISTSPKGEVIDLSPEGQRLLSDYQFTR
ncbi:MAG: hypothetical protein Q7S20_06465 [Gemmatimonadaceae bacterium]|nr:hypothetical protein [Gemmatimonadaceae bacterium]